MWIEAAPAGSRRAIRAQAAAAAVLAACCAAVAYSQGANAQSFSLKPEFGSVSLRAGFTPDPHTVEFPAGGLTSAEGLGEGCGGYLNPLRPDYRISYTPGQFPLRIFVESEVDTTLIVSDPAADWHCEDDSGPGVNPALEFTSPEAGEYHVWVGVFSQSSIGAPAQLSVSEFPLPASADGGGDPAPVEPGRGDAATPRFGGVALEGGFAPDPHIVSVEAGGPDRASSLAPDCVGFVSAGAPTYSLEYEPSAYQLRIYVAAPFDTTLAIRDPGGEWHCSDDSGPDGAPGIGFGAPAAGTYEIWVGVFSQDRWGDIADLSITESDFPWTEGDGVIGTGFFVAASGHILTNEHVASACESISVRQPGSLPVTAEVIAFDADADLALLWADVAPQRVASLRGGSSIRQGEQVVVYGFPLSGDLSPNLTVGQVSGLTGIGGDFGMIQISAEIQPGSSGSPVLDESGNVIGIATEVMLGAQNVNFAVRSSLARTLLDVNNVSYDVQGLGPPLPIPDIGDLARDFTVAISCEA